MVIHRFLGGFVVSPTESIFSNMGKCLRGLSALRVQISRSLNQKRDFLHIHGSRRRYGRNDPVFHRFFINPASYLTGFGLHNLTDDKFGMIDIS